jgi:hypothetical protein
VVMRAAKPRIKPKKKMAAAAKVKPNYKPRSMAKAVVPSRAKNRAAWPRRWSRHERRPNPRHGRSSNLSRGPPRT